MNISLNLDKYCFTDTQFVFYNYSLISEIDAARCAMLIMQFIMAKR